MAYYGLGMQYFALRFAKKGDTYFRLFLFLVWIMPVLIGIAGGVVTAPGKAMQMVMGLSPWAGMVLSIDGGPAVDADAASMVRFMALFPSLALAFLFQFLLINQQRRIDRGLTNSPMRPADKEPIMI